jgi:hypothetical protein
MKTFNIHALQVAKPCPMSWENMSGDDRTRFCQLCELSVYNISEMTAAEVRSLVENTDGRICGRLYKKADGTIITKDCPVGLRKYRLRAAKYFGAALAGILGLFSISFGQTNDKNSDKCRDETTVTRKTASRSGSKDLTGRVTDPNGAVVPDAKVTLVDSNGKKRSTKTKDDGSYLIGRIPEGKFELKISFNGFKNYDLKNIEAGKNEEINIDVVLLPTNANITVGLLMDTSELKTDSATIDRTIDREAMKRLPINNK